MRPSRTIVSALVLLFHHATVEAFSPERNVDFDKCWTDKVQHLNTSDYNDPYQWWGWDATHTNRTHNAHPQLNLLGCETLCGDGYQLWPLSDTFLRLVVWVFPLVALIAHFHFAPLGISNMIFIVTHLIGDPIDSMWSLLTRKEVNQRFHLRALRASLDNHEHIAAIWAAYDELGWQEPTEYFFQSLRNRREDLPPAAPVPGVNHESPSSRTPSPHPPSESAEFILSIDDAPGSPTPQAPNPRPSDPGDPNAFRTSSASQNIPSQAGGFFTDPPVPQQPPEVHARPTEEETYYIQLASHRLTSNRSESQLGTWFAILALLTSLAGAYTRTWVLQTNSQTPHTIAIVCLLFVLLPLVKISGDIGCFTSPSAAVDILFELRRNLRILSIQKRGPKPQIFPPLSIRDDNSWDYTSAPSQHEDDTFRTAEDASWLEHATELQVIEQWPRRAQWMGMNSSWRPCKRIIPIGEHSTQGKGQGLLFAISVAFTVVGYVSALSLSYTTPTMGFGCRSMAWTLILAAWTLSVAFDELFKLFVSSAKTLYCFTWAKDAVIFTFVIVTIAAAQLGFFNSCYCITVALTLRSDVHADIGPQSLGDFHKGWKFWLSIPLAALLFISALFWAISMDGGRGRTLLCKSQATRQAELQALQEQRHNLPQIEIGNSPRPVGQVRQPSPRHTVRQRLPRGELRDMTPSAENSQTGLVSPHLSRSSRASSESAH